MAITKTANNTYQLKVYVPKEVRPKLGIKIVTLSEGIKQERRQKKLN